MPAVAGLTVRASPTPQRDCNSQIADEIGEQLLDFITSQ